MTLWSANFTVEGAALHSEIDKRFPHPNVFAFDQEKTKSCLENERKEVKGKIQQVEVPKVSTATAFVSWCHANHDELQLEPR